MPTMKLKQARKRKRLTQTELAEISGVDQSTICAIETRRLKRPSWEIVARLARALEIAPDELFPVRSNGRDAA